MEYFHLFAGLIYLLMGGDLLVRGAVALARRARVPPVIIALSVVAFGTSLPELVVTLRAVLTGYPGIGIGNVVGSNICNIALVLGTAAVLQPITCHRSVINRDIPIMLAISVYLLLLSLNSTLGRVEGATLFGGILLYTFFNYYVAMKKTKTAGNPEAVLDDFDDEEVEYITSRGKQILLIAVGITGVVAGAEFVVESAVAIMKALGVSEKFIGLTIVAFGTSLPELATSVVAAMRKEMDISIGNLVGSNVFNILSVLGAASLVRPIPIPGGFIESGLIIDYGVMMFTSFLPWVLMRKTATVTRGGGMILLACYVCYLAYLIVKS